MDALFYADNPGKNIVEGREGCVRVLRVTLAQITGIGGIIGIDAGVIALEHDMDELIKKAEAGMYKEKETYYQQAGHDRRRRST